MGSSEAALCAGVALVMAVGMLEYGTVVVDRSMNTVRAEKHTLFSGIAQTIRMQQIRQANLVLDDPRWIELISGRGTAHSLHNLPSVNQEVEDMAEVMRDWLDETPQH